MYSAGQQHPMKGVGFPHSEISGSKLTYSSPELIGVRPVLHRLLVPRHPPCALVHLTVSGQFISDDRIKLTSDSFFLGFWFSYIIQFSRNDFESKPLKTEQNKRTYAGFRLQLRRILRKEVIQPHLPIRLPCYDFTPIIHPTFGGWLP